MGGSVPGTWQSDDLRLNPLAAVSCSDLGDKLVNISGLIKIKLTNINHPDHCHTVVSQHSIISSNKGDGTDVTGDNVAYAQRSPATRAIPLLYMETLAILGVLTLSSFLDLYIIL